MGVCTLTPDRGWALRRKRRKKMWRRKVFLGQFRDTSELATMERWQSCQICKFGCMLYDLRGQLAFSGEYCMAYTLCSVDGRGEIAARAGIFRQKKRCCCGRVNQLKRKSHKLAPKSEFQVPQSTLFLETRSLRLPSRRRPPPEHQTPG